MTTANKATAKKATGQSSARRTTKPTIDEAVNAIKAAIDPVAKSQQSGSERSTQRYSYRGRHAIVNALSALMAEHSVSVIPSGSRDLEADWETNQSGGVERFVSGHYRFQVRGPRGEEDAYEVEVYAEGMNQRDKAAGAALSYAYRYALEIVFAIPTGAEDNEENNEPAQGTSTGTRRQGERSGKGRISKGVANQLVAMLNSIEDDDERKAAKQDFVDTFEAMPDQITKAQLDKARSWIGAKVPEPFDVEGSQQAEDKPEENGLSAEENKVMADMKATKPTKTAKKATQKPTTEPQSDREAPPGDPSTDAAEEGGDAQEGSTADPSGEVARHGRSEMHRVMTLMPPEHAEELEARLSEAGLWPINKIEDAAVEIAVEIFAPIAEQARTAVDTATGESEGE